MPSGLLLGSSWLPLILRLAARGARWGTLGLELLLPARMLSP